MNWICSFYWKLSSSSVTFMKFIDVFSCVLKKELTQSWRQFMDREMSGDMTWTPIYFIYHDCSLFLLLRYQFPTTSEERLWDNKKNGSALFRLDFLKDSDLILVRDRLKNLIFETNSSGKYKQSSSDFVNEGNKSERDPKTVARNLYFTFLKSFDENFLFLFLHSHDLFRLKKLRVLNIYCTFWTIQMVSIWGFDRHAGKIGRMVFRKL